MSRKNKKRKQFSFLKKFHQLRKSIALFLGAFSLLFFILAVHLNFTQHEDLYASVTRVNAEGMSEQMIFRDYRSELVQCIENAVTMTAVESCRHW